MNFLLNFAFKYTAVLRSQNLKIKVLRSDLVMLRLQVRAQFASGRESGVKQLQNLSCEFAHCGDP